MLQLFIAIFLTAAYQNHISVSVRPLTSHDFVLLYRVNPVLFIECYVNG